MGLLHIKKFISVSSNLLVAVVVVFEGFMLVSYGDNWNTPLAHTEVSILALCGIFLMGDNVIRFMDD